MYSLPLPHRQRCYLTILATPKSSVGILYNIRTNLSSRFGILDVLYKKSYNFFQPSPKNKRKPILPQC
ncbi:hypothetical protein CLOSTMETH_03187 [[Clostridium] methylpentosum DSM 5476]|uniref:Uncharacterized protein n=1 Tax=[Clostridium] methylpentosum DSM 5476 TaxID=537013 RepID=C0EHF0_9FIRM|nr:hypothetical protein CLOSTMETH_03187 [[Clostridium] methylpentosum DSM 5476]